MFGFKKKKDRVEKKSEKMLWEITDEIIDRAERRTIENWDRNLAEARKRLGIENPHRDDDPAPKEPQSTPAELTEEQVKDILSNLSPGLQGLVDHWRAKGDSDEKIAELLKEY